jgi:hypothetical protein
MANTYLTTRWMTMDILRVLKGAGTVYPSFNTTYNKELDKEYPVGTEFDVPLPFSFAIRDGEQMATQNVIRRKRTIRMDSPFGVDFDYTGFDRALKMNRGEDMLRKEFTQPAGAQLADELDSRLCRFAYRSVPNIAGALGTDPSTINTYHLAQQRLEEYGCPEGEQRNYITPQAATALMNTSSTLFNPNDDVEDMWRKGKVGSLSGAKTFTSVRLARHTTGIVTSAAALTVNGNVANGATSISINCTAGDTFAQYERISIGGCFAVHPRARRSFGSALGNQAVFIVQQAVTASGTTATLLLDRAIRGPGDPDQNVDALPINNALVTRWPGTTIADGASVTGTVGLRLHGDALALVSAKLKLPTQVEFAEQARDPDTGISISIVQQYMIEKYTYPTRMDAWIGNGPLYPENCAVCILCA